MRECWLKPNQRVIGVALFGSCALLLIASLLVAIGVRYGHGLLSIAGGLVAIPGLWSSAYLVRCWRLPRLAYEDGELLIFVGSKTPMQVPIDIVEVFFLGSGPALAEGDDEMGPRTANVVVRLAEAANTWHQREMPAALGKWSEGYIVLRGAWCEPIGHERLNVMNSRLAEVRRQRRTKTEDQPPVTSNHS